jgi:type IV secretion system protein TrbE
MFNLWEYRNKPQHLADFLPWAALAMEGVVLNKDGSFLRVARFRGPDLESATDSELVGVTDRLNNALRRLGSGWAIFVEATRFPARGYPASTFPDPVSDLVERERRAQFEQEGAHFESAYFLTFQFLPPSEEVARAEALLYENRAEGSSVDPNEILNGFIDRTNRVLALIEGFVPEVAWLSDGELLTYLHSCISTRRQRASADETQSHDKQKRRRHQKDRLQRQHHRKPLHRIVHGDEADRSAGEATYQRDAPAAAGGGQSVQEQDRLCALAKHR